MANRIESWLAIQGAGPKFDAFRPVIEGVVEDAQSWHPRRWIRLNSITVTEDGDDIFIDFGTDWDRGDKLVEAIHKKLAEYVAVGRWEGECEPPEGRWEFYPGGVEAFLMSTKSADGDTKEYLPRVVAHYAIPAEHPNFVYILPALYVAISDGDVSVKEAMTVGFNADEVLGLTLSEEYEALQGWIGVVLAHLAANPSVDGFDMVANAVNELLDAEDPDRANQIREGIHSMCIKVAKTSGPLFREKVSAEERAMLDKIFGSIEA